MQDPFTISDGFDDDITTYTVSHLDSATGNVCSRPAIIPASMCLGGTCKHVFEVSDSFCHPSTNISVSVTTTSSLGSEIASDSITIGKCPPHDIVKALYTRGNYTILCVCVHVCVHVGVCVCVYMYMCVCVYVYKRMYNCVCVCSACLCTCVCAYVYV